MNQKWYFHIDFNYFFAQCEKFKNPKLRNLPVAVCGLKEDRHGIAMAKCPIAKAAGVKTAMAIWQAKQLCPNLVIVPPDLDYYKLVSRKAKAIYSQYTNLIESFGLDECFLDVTEGLRLFGGDPYKLAQQIMKELFDQLGLTASIGIAFTKKLAKLGSDISGISEIYYITPENLRKKVWGIKTRELVYIGAATERKLKSMGIQTLGDLAKAHPEVIRMALGVNGLKHWFTVNGMDMARVCLSDYEPPIKSVSRGVTCKLDLISNEDAKVPFMYLAQEIARKLRKDNLKTKEIQVYLSFFLTAITMEGDSSAN